MPDTSSSQRSAIILDSDMLFVISIEELLAQFGFKTQALTTPSGAFAQIEFQKPDVLLVELKTQGLNTEDLFQSIQLSTDLSELVIVLHSHEPASVMQEVCSTYNLNGYFSKKMEPEKLGPFLLQFFP